MFKGEENCVFNVTELFTLLDAEEGLNVNDLVQSFDCRTPFQMKVSHGRGKWSKADKKR